MGLLVGICDDQSVSRTEIAEILSVSVEENSGEMIQFSCGEDVIKYNGEIDVLFLDLEMPGIDGVETGVQVYRKWPQCKIIVATGRTDRFKEAFKFRAYRFVEKPFCKRDVEEAFLDAVFANVGMEMVEFYYYRNTYNIKQRDIKYINAMDGYVECRVGNLVMRKEISVQDMLKCLDMRIFCKINRSTIVNMLHVSKVENGRLFIGNSKFLISRNNRKNFLKVYDECDLHYKI